MTQNPKCLPPDELETAIRLVARLVWDAERKEWGADSPSKAVTGLERFADRVAADLEASGYADGPVHQVLTASLKTAAYALMQGGGKASTAHSHARSIEPLASVLRLAAKNSTR